MVEQEHRYTVLTRTDAGTPMGELMRQYWVPAITSDELIADGDPVRVKLLGEDLIAFRTTSGKVGVMDQRCPHRVASLFYGRNEEDGIRCVYHGWKFDADGKCVDQGNIPVEQQFCERTPAKAYPTQERAGVVWAYMGHAATPPAMPDIAILNTDEATSVRCTLVECNWLQRIEGDIDTSHAGFLHAENREKMKNLDISDNPRLLMYTNLTPRFKMTDTDYGTMYGAVRTVDEKTDYWRIGHYLFPFFAMAGAPALGIMALGATVPMDDHHCMRFNITTENARVQRQTMANPMNAVRTADYQPNTTDWYGRWRLVQIKENDYLLDRDKQRHGGSYTGVRGVNAQDQCITESMGPILLHSWENLAPPDIMIVRTRQRILNVLDDVTKGIAAPGVKDPEIYRGVAGGWAIMPNDKDWLEAYTDVTKHEVRTLENVAD